MNSAGLRRKTRNESSINSKNSQKEESTSDFFDNYQLKEEKSERDPKNDEQITISNNTEAMENHLDAQTNKETEYFTPRSDSNQMYDPTLEITKNEKSQTEEKSKILENELQSNMVRYSEDLNNPKSMNFQKNNETFHAMSNTFELFKENKANASKPKCIFVNVANDVEGKSKIKDVKNFENELFSMSPKSNIANTEFSKDSMSRISSIANNAENHAINNEIFNLSNDKSVSTLLSDEKKQELSLLDPPSCKKKEDIQNPIQEINQINTYPLLESEEKFPVTTSSNILSESQDKDNEINQEEPQKLNSSKSSKRKSNESSEKPVPHLNFISKKENESKVSESLSNEMKKISKEGLSKRRPSTSTKFVRNCLVCVQKIEKGQPSKMLACAHRFHEVFLYQ